MVAGKNLEVEGGVNGLELEGFELFFFPLATKKQNPNWTWTRARAPRPYELRFDLGLFWRYISSAYLY